MRFIIVFLVLFVFTSSWGQKLDKKEIQSLTKANFRNAVSELENFLKLPNLGSNPVNIDENLAWCETQFTKLNFDTRILVSEGVKHLYAERINSKRAKTILFYLQIDGQPVDTSEWNQASPYIPVLKECNENDCHQIQWNRSDEWNPDWKIYARSASDSKGPATAFIQALKLLKQEGINSEYNLKVIMDFQEEMGSPTLPNLVTQNREIFSADAMLIMDGTRPPGNLPTLTFGARGIATMTLTVYGAYNNLHSGQYGNYAPNPAFTLARVLGNMKDEHGRVLIPGFYDGVDLTEDQKRIVNAVPEDKEVLLSTLGIYKPDSVGNTYQESLQYPSLNIRGLKAAWTGDGVRTIIPATAIAEIDMRLVPETPGERQIDLVTNFIKSSGFHIVTSEPTQDERRKYPLIMKVESRTGSKPFRTNINSPLGDWLGLAMDRAFGGGNYIRMQSTGGSQPIAPFISTLNVPAVSVRIPNPDNSIHAPNENLRLGNFYEGIQMCLAILTQSYE